MSVNFGLTDYGRLKYMLKMADLLKEKKLYEKIAKAETDKAEENKKKIEDTQKKARELLEQMEKYSKSKKSLAVIGYAQFQSMNGKEKFIKAIRGVGWCMRCCSDRHKHKL